MDHPFIEEENIAERYLMKRLMADERAEFELHFLECPQCIESLEEIGELRAGLRLIDERDWTATKTAAGGRRFLVPAWAPAFAFALVLALIAAAGFLLIRHRRLANEMIEARAGLNRMEARVEELEQQTSIASRQESSPRPGNSDLSKADAAFASPRTNVPVFVLSALRSSSESNVIQADQSSDWFLLSVELERAPEYKSYRVTIRSGQGRVRWTGNDLKPDRYDSLTMSFGSRFFSPGQYVLNVEGNSAGGHSPVAEFAFRVANRK